MAADLRNTGLVVATDVRGRRIELLRQTVVASGATNIRIVQADASRPPFPAMFDCVLLDAPCSGLGTLRRDPDLKWRRTEADFPALQGLQRSMLRAVAGVLKPGGRLVYSTCSSEPEENEALIREFTANSDWRVVRPAALPPGVEALITDEGFLRTYPFRDAVEGFFAAVLKRG
jgi:16S rRNA (cytosine967-C5)-methyltransferase